VAYAARCARRVQPLFRLDPCIPQCAEHEAAVERAISVAERFCLFRDIYTSAATLPTAAATYATATAANAYDSAAAAYAAAATAAAAAAPDAAAAYAAADAYDSAAAAYAAGAFTASAAYAGHAASAAASAAAYADFHALLQLKLGAYPELGQPIDPTENGPLGPLWRDGAPDWFTRPVTRKPRARPESIPDAQPVLEVFIEPGDASKENIQEVLEALSDLHRESGGLGLEFSVDGLFVMAREGVTA
jgi:hypothetical protein